MHCAHGILAVLAVAITSLNATAARAQTAPRPSQCGGYGNPDLRAQCLNSEAVAASIARGEAARTDLLNSKLKAAARKDDTACAATIKAGIAEGRYTDDDLRIARAGRAWRSLGDCNILRQLQKR